jgi:hypothetical protein
VWLYQGPRGNPFAILNRGTPINFRDNSILGRYLYLVYGALFFSMGKLVRRKVRPGLQELEEGDNDIVASAFSDLLSVGHRWHISAPDDGVRVNGDLALNGTRSRHEAHA